MSVPHKEEQVVVVLGRCIRFEEKVSHKQVRPEGRRSGHNHESSFWKVNIKLVSRGAFGKVDFVYLPSRSDCRINSFVRWKLISSKRNFKGVALGLLLLLLNWAIFGPFSDSLTAASRDFPSIRCASPVPLYVAFIAERIETPTVTVGNEKSIFGPDGRNGARFEFKGHLLPGQSTPPGLY